MEEPQVRVGWLDKRSKLGPFKTWKLRFVVLKSGTLEVFEKKRANDDPPYGDCLLGSIDLSSASIILSKNPKKINIYGAFITATGNKEKDAVFAISDHAMNKIWRDGIQEHIEYAKRLIGDEAPSSKITTHTPQIESEGKKVTEKRENVEPEAFDVPRIPFVFADILPNPRFVIQSRWPTGEKVFINICDFADFPDDFKKQDAWPYMISSAARMESQDIYPAVAATYDEGVWIYDVLVDKATLSDAIDIGAPEPAASIVAMMREKECSSAQELICLCVIDHIARVHKETVGPDFAVLPVETEADVITIASSLDEMKRPNYRGKARTLRVPFKWPSYKPERPDDDADGSVVWTITSDVSLSKYKRKVPYCIIHPNGVNTFISPRVPGPASVTLQPNSYVHIFARRKVEGQTWLRASEGWIRESIRGRRALIPASRSRMPGGANFVSVRFKEKIVPQPKGWLYSSPDSVSVEMWFRIDVVYGKDAVLKLSRSFTDILELKKAVDASTCPSVKYAKAVAFPKEYYTLNGLDFFEDAALTFEAVELLEDWVDEIIQLVDMFICKCEPYVKFWNITKDDQILMDSELMAGGGMEGSWTDEITSS